MEPKNYEIDAPKVEAVLQLMGHESVPAFKEHLMDRWEEEGKPPREVNCILPEIEILGVKVKFLKSQGRLYTAKPDDEAKG